ncbi:MAG: DEAD/DEAH box helicase family protein [Anaerolineae bacterium]|nr:DEAD/DEAH box helicase family protein [Anaerolineae bacterium]
MSRTSLDRFQRRLALVAYFRHVFGVEDVHDPRSVRAFYDMLKQQPEGYNAEGRSYVANVLEGLVRGIDAGQLLGYDANVRRHTEALNRRRAEPITLKYFQVLAALMTEHYLERTAQETEAFLADLNAFVSAQNGSRAARVDYPVFGAGDLNKLAYWMATGSGKTLLMHINYYQYLHYHPGTLDNILLVTTGEGMSEQHIAEMEKSGIPCRQFSASSADLFGIAPHTVKVIEIHKLVEEKMGGGESVEVASFEGRNLVFVDEGHKGTGSEAQTWRGRREALARDGFTFEYSATFGQAVAGAGADVEEEYGRAILFDYSYPRFYDDGYGKDYRILNLEHDLDPALTNRYLMANLLTFYEQLRCYGLNAETFYTTYNVAPPLLVFIGHSVTAGKTRSQLTRDDKRSLADVQEMILFLHRVLQNEGNWVPGAIDAILCGEAGLSREDGGDLFADAFRTLRDAHLDGAAIYADMLRRVFHVAAAAGLHLVDLKSAAGEIGLRAGAADQFFGVINIGDAANFLKLTEERVPEISIEQEQFAGSLFQAINQRDSSINVLIGSKKFIEGWDSWRVSTMGLLNIGRGEGPQIIQLFGRGVRLLGKGQTLQRSEALAGDHPGNLPLLETLSIFGVRARYIAQFRDYLAEEGIDTEEREVLVIETRPGPDFEGRGLLVVRPEFHGSFEDSVRLELQLDEACKPTIDLMPSLGEIVSSGLTRETPASFEPQDARRLPADALPLFDWNRLYRQVWHFCTARNYHNLALDQGILRHVLEQGCYQLLCSPKMLEIASFGDVGRLEEIALMILRKYVERYYTRAHRRWEQDQMAYQALDWSDENLISAYEARVKRSATDFLRTLHEMLENPDLYEKDEEDPPRVHFDRHLYLPLLLEDTTDEQVVKYSPPGLNPGERHFVEQLRAYVGTEEGQSLLEERDRDLFLLRNQSRGRGVGFLVNDEKFFPDFILWLIGPERQDIVFIDPHGLIIGGNLEANPKVQFYETIKGYERKLNERAGREDIVLHSYIISQASFEDLRKQTGITQESEFHRLHVYFREREDYIALLLRDVLPEHLLGEEGSNRE